jgi:hypothetical protein
LRRARPVEALRERSPEIERSAREQEVLALIGPEHSCAAGQRRGGQDARMLIGRRQSTQLAPIVPDRQRSGVRDDEELVARLGETVLREARP